MEKDIRRFFAEYEERFNKALRGIDDAPGTAAAFADCFVGASPAGVFCGRNDQEFLENIPKGNARYRNIGTRLMRINDLEITTLNEMHYLVKVYWHSEYHRQDGSTAEIDFEVFYLLQHKDGTLKIFCYITGDEQAELRKHGVI